MIRMIFAASIGLAAAGPQPLAPFTSGRNDYNLSMDGSERIAVFARSDADFANARIFVARKVRGGWSEPTEIGFTDPRFSDSDPWLTPDGRTLYFVSDRPAAGRGERTDLDIWRSVHTADGWGAPEHLGDAVNSPGPELGPELHAGVLTFSAVRRGGKGGLDIYAARLSGSSFSEPEPLSGPFNSKESDSDFTLSRDGRMAAFWRGGATAKIMISRRMVEGWSEPQALPETLNLGPFNFTPAFSADGRWLRYASTVSRAEQANGLADIFVAKLP